MLQSEQRSVVVGSKPVTAVGSVLLSAVLIAGMVSILHSNHQDSAMIIQGKNLVVGSPDSGSTEPSSPATTTSEGGSTEPSSETAPAATSENDGGSTEPGVSTASTTTATTSDESSSVEDTTAKTSESLGRMNTECDVSAKSISESQSKTDDKAGEMDETTQSLDNENEHWSVSMSFERDVTYTHTSHRRDGRTEVKTISSHSHQSSVTLDSFTAALDLATEVPSWLKTAGEMAEKTKLNAGWFADHLRDLSNAVRSASDRVRNKKIEIFKEDWDESSVDEQELLLRSTARRLGVEIDTDDYPGLILDSDDSESPMMGEDFWKKKHWKKHHKHWKKAGKRIKKTAKRAVSPMTIVPRLRKGLKKLSQNTKNLASGIHDFTHKVVGFTQGIKDLPMKMKEMAETVMTVGQSVAKVMISVKGISMVAHLLYNKVKELIHLTIALSKQSRFVADQLSHTQAHTSQALKQSSETATQLKVFSELMGDETVSLQGQITALIARVAALEAQSSQH